MTPSEQGVIQRAAEFIASWEGMRLNAYWDVGGYSICYGNRAQKGDTTTEEDCNKRLYARVKQVKEYVEKLYNRDLTDNQLIALTSFHYNVKNATHVIWRGNNDHSDQSIANAIRFYTHAGGVELAGLVKRREAESELFLTN